MALAPTGSINQKQSMAFNTLDVRFPRQFAHELNIKASEVYKSGMPQHHPYSWEVV